jgi:carboxyl-terminal processing protease
MTSYLQEALYTGLLSQYAFVYVDYYRDNLKKFEDWEELAAYLKKQNLPEKFANFAAKNGLRRRNLMLHESKNLFQDFIISYIMDDFYGTEQKIMYTNLTDPCMLKAKDVFSKNLAFPSKPDAAAPLQAKSKKKK